MTDKGAGASAVSPGRAPQKVRPMAATLHLTGVVASGFLRLIPKTRGNWLLGTKLAQLVPGARYAKLSLRHEAFSTDLELNLADPAQFTMVRSNRFDLMTAGIVASILRGGDTFVDVGANWGYLSCIASRRVGSTGLVLAL